MQPSLIAAVNRIVRSDWSWTTPHWIAHDGIPVLASVWVEGAALDEETMSTPSPGPRISGSAAR
jgi:hypothetical protein